MTQSFIRGSGLKKCPSARVTEIELLGLSYNGGLMEVLEVFSQGFF